MQELPAGAIPERKAVANGDANNATSGSRRAPEAPTVMVRKRPLCHTDPVLIQRYDARMENTHWVHFCSERCCHWRGTLRLLPHPRDPLDDFTQPVELFEIRPARRDQI
jgi:hypothetical protein